MIEHVAKDRINELDNGSGKQQILKRIFLEIEIAALYDFEGITDSIGVLHKRKVMIFSRLTSSLYGW